MLAWCLHCAVHTTVHKAAHSRVHSHTAVQPGHPTAWRLKSTEAVETFVEPDHRCWRSDGLVDGSVNGLVVDGSVNGLVVNGSINGLVVNGLAERLARHAHVAIRLAAPF
jgi:hypothetical protein